VLRVATCGVKRPACRNTITPCQCRVSLATPQLPQPINGVPGNEKVCAQQVGEFSIHPPIQPPASCQDAVLLRSAPQMKELRPSNGQADG
jgi:hypothetical protein